MRWSRVQPASRRFSSTVRSLKSRRCSGTSARPARTSARRLGAGDVGAFEAHAARGRPQQAGHGVQQRRLTGAVGADDCNQFARVHRERRIVQCRDGAVARGDLIDLEHELSRPAGSAGNVRGSHSLDECRLTVFDGQDDDVLLGHAAGAVVGDRAGGDRLVDQAVDGGDERGASTEQASVAAAARICTASAASAPKLIVSMFAPAAVASARNCSTPLLSCGNVWAAK